jgi:hypothetical protein
MGIVPRDFSIRRKAQPEPGICPLVDGGVACIRPVRYRGLCDTHRARLKEAGRIEDFATPPSARVLTKKAEPREGVCLVVEDGAMCVRRARFRGLCDPHRIYLTKVGRLEELALPSQAGKKSTFVVDPEAPEGICWIVQDGRHCVRRARPIGICGTHRSVLHKRPDLPIERFVRRTAQIAYSRRKHPEPGKCVVRECRPVPGQARGRYVECDEAPESRGLCRKHRHRLEKTPPLFEQIANPLRKRSEFRLKVELKDGVCVIVQDDVGCTLATTHPRRACDLHREVLRRAEMLGELTDRFVGENYSLERKPPHARVPGFCLLVVNGVPCTGEPQHRGLCHNCYHLVHKYDDYEALALPLKERREPAFARKDRVLRGVCLLVEDGAPCREPMLSRGLCKRHYRLLKKRGRVAELGLAPGEFDRLPALPHYYFDKNVPIRFAMFEAFGTCPDRSSVGLVQAVLAGKVRATVSLDCVRATYSHLGHRLARSSSEGGKGLDEATAERAAREYAGKLYFGRGGLWSFLPPTEDSFRACALEGNLPGLSLEDALEVHLFAVAKRDHGAEMFVTADAGILKYGEAVHPEKVVSANPGLFR